MTEIAQDPMAPAPTPSTPPADPAGATRDLQRQSLEQIVKLSIAYCCRMSSALKSSIRKLWSSENSDYQQFWWAMHNYNSSGG